jgi:hypothetical protein
MFKFHFRYFISFLALLVIEVLIALFAHNAFVRPYVGDGLVVILLYCLIKSFFKVPVWWAAISVLVFSYVVEILQYFKLVELIGLQKYSLARILIGTTFQWGDLVAYAVGIGVVLGTERILKDLYLEKR